MKIKLQKFIADCGYCSRRRAEELIVKKKVKVNKKVASVGMRVDENDKIFVEGKALQKKEKEHIYVMLNKPKNYTCTHRKIENEKNIFKLINLKERLFIIGRLDKDSHGLVLLTNDGSFAYKLTHPSFSHEKEYLVMLDKNLNTEVEKEITSGIDIGEKTLAKAKNIEKVNSKKYKITLTEGKHRQIRRSFGALGFTVLDIKRVRIDKYKLGNLKRGTWRHFTP